ncbi:TPA: TadE/TadG family type IV pilus assembly protein [Raoultella planticola]|uniref:TadE/TadG family type IV pilus assembly protein n=1 Tax=Raoultella planticola TaxID=575 RepID=UPI0005163B7B|nr:TadE/TadG family type IV pilus assembly protein [Raoultella planticola]
MRSRFLRFIVRLLRQEYGAITVMFAIMFPLLMMFYSVAYDGANLQSSRARLADGLNQGVLAVAMVDNRNSTAADKAENITLLHNYLSYYVPDATIAKNDLTVAVEVNYSTTETGKLDSVDYTASGKASMRPIIGAQQEVGFDSAVDIRADSGAGVVRKTFEEIKYPTDYALVLDFSGSMLSSSSEPGLTRIELLRKVVTEFIGEVLNDDSVTNTVGIIPFTAGVSVILPGENIAGGGNFGCSYVGKFLPKYAGVDLDFWYNKIRFNTTATTPTEVLQSYNYDSLLYGWYNDVVSPATGFSIDEMVNKGWCVKNPQYGSTVGRAQYSCDADTRANLFNHYTEFQESRAAAHELMYYAYTQRTIFNTVTMDFDGLVADDFMFSDQAVTTFKYMVNTIANRPFYFDCYSTFGSISTTVASNTLKSKTAKPASYLIELTNDRQIIDKFREMNVTDGTTYVTSGLLRALPVIAKGNNPRKAIIVISDGIDIDGGVLTKKLFDQYNLCNRIREGLLRYPEGTPTQLADIFFIFTVNSSETTTALDLWRNYCAGDNVFLATNYQDIINVLTGIAKKSSVKFINKNEPE